jgi:SAM-dependent methyltransferase
MGIRPDFMDEIAKRIIPTYDSIVDEFYQRTKDLEEKAMAERTEFASLLKKGGKILDLGCGHGRDCKIFSDWGFKVIGTDLSTESLKKAKQVAPEAEFRIMDFLDMDFKGETFDGIWFNAGLLCVEKKNAVKVLKDIHKALVGGGVFFMSVKEGHGEGFEMDKRYGLEKYYAYYQEDEVKALLSRTGFHIIKTYKILLKASYHQHPWLGFLCRKA